MPIRDGLISGLQAMSAETGKRMGEIRWHTIWRKVSAGCQPWRTYLEARCLENRVPILAANITLPNLYAGCSRIMTVSETGMGIGVVETLAEAGVEEGVITSEVDLEKPLEMRRDRLSQRVPEAYENI